MKTKHILTLALLSLSLMALELAWTRIFSAEFFYTFAFLILSLAILGLGLGALTLRLSRFLNRIDGLGVILTLTGLMISVSPILVFKLNLDFSQLFNNGLMLGKFALTVILLSSAFFFGGIALAKIFKAQPEKINQLYLADLAGAAAGVFLAIVFMNACGTPLATFLSAVPVLLAAVISSKKWLKLIPIALLGLLALPGSRAESLLVAKREERAPVIYHHWDAMSKVKIYEFSPDYRGINIDNAANSPVERFDGNWNRPDSARFQFNIPVQYLIQQFDSCTFLSLGAGGGQDVLQALQEGASEIHAVEVNSHVNALMLTGDLAEFSGQIYHDPRVKVITEDARAYVRRFQNKFDLIYSLSSNSFSALASGAFALAENYLFTTEAFEDYWLALSDSGFMMLEHQFYVPRLVAELMNALENQGVPDATAHFAVYNLPQLRRQLILLSKRPLTDEIRNRAFFELTPENYSYLHLLYPPAADSLKGKLINQIVVTGWEHAQPQAPVDISPCTDNRPFAAQLGLWKNFHWNKLEKISPYEFAGFPLAKIMIVMIILVVLLLILPLNLLPYFFKGDKLKAAPWFYFFFIGMGFMMLEVVLIQKYALFIGPSIYSFSTVLLTLLLASGVGSFFAPKVPSRLVFGFILGWLLLDIFIFNHLFYLLGGLELGLRIFVSALLLFPLGFFMGMPFPKGTLRVGTLVDWGFAVNGAASVLGSTIVVMVAFTFGFQIALLIGAGCYLAAFLLALKAAW
jgi:predicted membrane-bound spermidine synthase